MPPQMAGRWRTRAGLQRPLGVSLLSWLLARRMIGRSGADLAASLLNGEDSIDGSFFADGLGADFECGHCDGYASIRGDFDGLR